MLLSLVRTRRVGYLRDIRRLTVALSRARLGLYILGRQEIFESSFELKEAFDRLLSRPTNLMVVPGETFPTTRVVEDEVEAVEMTGVEHMGQYVYEMTQAKIRQLSAGVIALPPEEATLEREEEEEIADVDGEEDGEPPQPEGMVV